MSWEEERPIYEEELTPQQREEAVKAAKERMEKAYQRGRKTIFIMMAVYVAMNALTAVLNVVVAERSRKGGYVTIGLLDIVFALLIAYNLYNGRTWARVLFAILLGFSVLSLLGGIARLDIGRTDYSKPSANGHVTLVYSEGKLVESWKLGKAELAEMQKQEDARVTIHRIAMVVGLFSLAVQGTCLYLLFFYRPVREFLYGQGTDT